MFSMTGFGKGEYKADGIEISVEVKTVNNRYLDVAIKSPKIFNAYEEIIRSAVRERITRGHLDVFVNYIDKRERPKSLYVDAGAASGYCAAAKKLKDLFPGLADDFTLTALMRSPDVVRQEETQGADEALLNALQAALCKALDNLNAMRKKEGEKLSDDMLSRMDAVEKLVDEISARAPLVAAQYKSKLEERMKEILNGAAYDEARLLTEVAVFTDKANIDEELTRLRSHIAQFRNICREERVGRKLDFLVQEFNRECNTVCSKSNDLKVTDCGLALKNEIEKIREQVQNVE
ncbi:YicC family protein [Candidatus Borkfalkia ceftriaxoniphila]|uniref:YicC family protein n=1 Tax=Candidatus Borkfalkia ceftriaxoniphila TaxID=2508949 RepID=A0A4Q2KD78_9FIRM|nr:YicC/YloC family endoribonuclease [Candidatus Borkfalkia ceftriaxoniphila]RXZ61979.1 YicC family protein [Candidatus Borkfalkia ceftriaxoniphila]